MDYHSTWIIIVNGIEESGQLLKDINYYHNLNTKKAAERAKTEKQDLLGLVFFMQKHCTVYMLVFCLFVCFNVLLKKTSYLKTKR